MALWGTSATAATNKPKYLPDDTNSKYDITKCYATQAGWVMRSGTSATGNGNADATPEILVAIRGLAGATATTGLKHPTITRARWQDATILHSAGADNIKLDVTWDEEVKYTAGTAPVIATATTVVNLTLTHIDGIAIASNTTGSTFTFTGSTSAAGTYTIANAAAMTNYSTLTDAVSTVALEAASYTFVTAILPGNCVAS